MPTMRKLSVLSCAIVLLSPLGIKAQPSPGEISDIRVISNQLQVVIKPFPAADRVSMVFTTNLTSKPYTNNGSSANATGSLEGYLWTTNVFTFGVPATRPNQGFYKPQITSVDSNRLWTAALLNRLAYGPTPDDLDRILGATNNFTTNAGIGPAAWLAEQLNPSSITETVTNANTNVSFYSSRFANEADYIRTNETVGVGTAGLNELRGWFFLHAVYGKRQLLEVLNQFFENLFVTEYSKGRDFFAGPYNGIGGVAERQSTRLEWIENRRWRQALVNSQCTFSNMLLIQAESSAQIIYLDTQDSRSDGNNVANENYAREIMELYSMGVDNGYDQYDITEMSPCWTGWNCRFVNVSNATNVFAPQEPGTISNTLGVWAFNFRSDRHGIPGNSTNAFTTNRIFYKHNPDGSIVTGTNGFKIVNPRFGPPWTTRIYGTNTIPGAYALYLPPLSGTNNIQDGYQIVKHLADLPYTQEFISYKLCRLLVNDKFLYGEVNGYDFNVGNSNLANWYGHTPEGRLMRDCMLAWETNTPQGQIYKVISVIANSDLFKTNALRQKVKTPIEFAASTVRSLRMNVDPSGAVGPTNFTASTDGDSIAGGNVSTPLIRMGNMGLFDRDTPDGYPEDGNGWISAGTLNERIRWVQTALMAVGTASKSDGITGGNNTVIDPMALITRRLNLAQQQDIDAIVNLFLDLIYLGEGSVNLDLYRTMAKEYLSQNADGTASSYASAPASGPNSKEERVRGMVALLLSMPRAHEQ